MFSVLRKPMSNGQQDTKVKKEEQSQSKAKTFECIQTKPEEKVVIRNENISKISEKEKLNINGPNEEKERKRIKIRLSIIKDVPYSQRMESKEEKKKKPKELKMKTRRINREGNFNCG